MIQFIHRIIHRNIRLWLVSLFTLTLSLAIALQSCTGDRPLAAPSATPQPGDQFTERIAQEHQGDHPTPNEVALQAPAQAVVSKEVQYATVNGQPVTGFLAQPAKVSTAPPGIIAIHEWWGLNDNIKSVAKTLAGEGYSVLAVDLYNKKVADQPDQARQLMQDVLQNEQPAKENLRQAYEYLVQSQGAPKVGSIGWCFGGGWSLNTGLLLPKQLNALVIYYGRLQTDPAILASLDMPIAGFFGGQDKGIPVSDVRAFEAALKDLDKPAEIYIYDDADHAFANPSGGRYNPKAAADAWTKTKAFFAKNLKGA